MPCGENGYTKLVGNVSLAWQVRMQNVIGIGCGVTGRNNSSSAALNRSATTGRSSLQ